MTSSRYYIFYGTVIAAAALLAAAVSLSGVFYWPLAVVLPLALLGVRDLLQTDHSVLRNYPVIGHLRYLFEDVRPELRQYFFESNLDGTPFSRERRSLVYNRCKDEEGSQPFGTELNVYAADYRWVNHSIATKPLKEEALRISIGGPDCTQPYSASLYNISAMSFGALSANAIRALNKGAAKGGFAHDTGEGAISPHHREFGGDLIWEIGSGYFGCRTEDGDFDPDRFAAQAKNDQVKMIEIKLSQGAKPGHGGVLPAAKITPEIAETRGIPMGRDCVSPAKHGAFSTPVELMRFIGCLRELSGGKPVGFKLCVGHRWEFMAMCKAMMKTEILPDFIVVDGAEGGTGAAPVEFSDHMGTPLREGLMFVHNVLVGCNLRDRIRIGASGKLISAFDIFDALARGADWANSARGFMFAVGCIQSQSCHTNRCPVGVATQDPKRQRALVVSDKAERVYRFHRNTLRAFAEFVAASGLDHPSELRKRAYFTREIDRAGLIDNAAPRFLEPGALLGPEECRGYSKDWAAADPDDFAPRPPEGRD